MTASTATVHVVCGQLLNTAGVSCLIARASSQSTPAGTRPRGHYPASSKSSHCRQQRCKGAAQQRSVVCIQLSVWRRRFYRYCAAFCCCKNNKHAALHSTAKVPDVMSGCRNASAAAHATSQPMRQSMRVSCMLYMHVNKTGRTSSADSSIQAGVVVCLGTRSEVFRYLRDIGGWVCSNPYR